MVIAAVVGGEVGSEASKSTSSSTSNSGTGTATASISLPTSTSAAEVQRNIAAVSYVAANVNNTRVYYQNSAGNLTEAVAKEGSSWSNRVLQYAPKSGSPLAAAVTNTWGGFPLVCYFSSFQEAPISDITQANFRLLYRHDQ